MAGVISAPHKSTQLFLVGWLRWRLFVNGLRTATGKLNLAVHIIMGSGIGLGTVGLGVLLGLGSWYAIRFRKPPLLSVELWLVFLVWLLFPLIVSGFGAEADPVSLLRFPLRYSTFVLLALAHGAFDPVAIACLYWLAAMLLGLAVASLSALRWAIPAFAALAFLNLLLNRTIYAWLSRWMAQRRTREILGAVGILLAISGQFISPLANRYGRRALPWVSRLGAADRALPPVMAASTVALGRAGHPGKAGAGFAGLLAYCGVFGWLLAIRLRAEYRGENLSEASRPSVEAHVPVRAGWNVTGLSPTVAALFEKDLRYLLRNTMTYLTLVTPPLIILVFGLGGRGSPNPKITGFILGGSTYFPMGVAYVLLSVVGLAYNSMAFDGPGLPILFAAPVRFRDVMVAKNLLHSIVFAAEVSIVFVLVQLVRGPCPPAVVGLTLAGAVWIFLVNLTAGNLVSLYFPRKMKPGQMRRQQASGMAMLVTLGVQVAVVGVVAGLYLLSRWVGNMAWCGIGLVGLSGITWVAYQRVLELVSGIAWKRREALLAELSRPD